LRREAPADVNLQPLINTNVTGQQQRQQEQAVARLEKEAKENAMVLTWLSHKTLMHLLKYWGVLDSGKCEDCLQRS
jgi:hypothetical protein